VVVDGSVSVGELEAFDVLDALDAVLALNGGGGLGYFSSLY
jgi:hypothetical protein